MIKYLYQEVGSRLFVGIQGTTEEQVQIQLNKFYNWEITNDTEVDIIPSYKKYTAVIETTKEKFINGMMNSYHTTLARRNHNSYRNVIGNKRVGLRYEVARHKAEHTFNTMTPYRFFDEKSDEYIYAWGNTNDLALSPME